MDLEHLQNLVNTAAEEGEDTNDTGPRWDELVLYLDELRHEIAHQAAAIRSRRR